MADRGKEDTVMFEKKGLVYSIIDDNGKRVGISFKASVLSNKPTNANLEKKFVQNAERRKAFKEPLKETIEKVFTKYAAISKATFTAEMAKQNIGVVFRTNDQGFTYGLTFIDHRNKTVFNGSDLGKAYSAKTISERLSVADKLIKPEQRTYLKPVKPTNYLRRSEPAKIYLKPPELGNFLKGMLDKTITDHGGGMPRKKKKRKRSPNQQQEQSL